MTLSDLSKRACLTVRQAIRQKGTPFLDLKLDNEALSDDALLDAMMAHPILINRPFVVTPSGVRLCRPSELVLDLLEQHQLDPFVEEDGDVGNDKKGQRLHKTHENGLG